MRSDLRGRVAAAIRKAREAKGWTQEELGRRLGVTQSTVAGWEGQGSFPGSETLQRIADETGMMLLAPVLPRAGAMPPMTSGDVMEEIDKVESFLSDRLDAEIEHRKSHVYDLREEMLEMIIELRRELRESKR